MKEANPPLFDKDPSDFDNDSAYAFIVDLDGYGGPLNVLLDLARTQKVDLLRISVLKLVDQYVDFVSRAKRDHIELASDYLVMAAWLLFLKSKLLLPKRDKSEEKISPELLSSHLAWRLKRLDAMRVAYENLSKRPQANVDTFARGMNDEALCEEIDIYQADILDLLKAYGRQRNKVKAKVHTVRQWPVYSLEDARASLRTKVPKDDNWHEMAKFAPSPKEINGEMPSAKSQYASLLSAGLEMVKQGEISIRQLAVYDKVFLKRGGKNGTNS